MESKRESFANNKSMALQFILLLGAVSAFGDITYEGARSISGPYLALLGAGASAIGLVSGMGEFIGYALRLLSGYVADRTKAYWVMTFLGYGALLCIPLLALTHRWELAALLLILERAGKAVRAPARDVILSHATKQTGRGWGFAIHEALDQVGAVIGPLIFTVAFVLRAGYRTGFTILWIPAILSLVVLAIARIRVPSPEKLETSAGTVREGAKGRGGLGQVFWFYALFTFLSVAGFANFQLISYHFAARSVVPVAQIPLLYAIAMGLDALMALAVGRAYDKIGLISLVVVPFLTIPIPFLAFSQSYTLAVISVLLWGTVMAVHETTMRAAIADITPVEHRGFAYGVFNTIYGASWFVGSALMGVLYDVASRYLISFVVVVGVVALLAFFLVRKANQKSILR